MLNLIQTIMLLLVVTVSAQADSARTITINEEVSFPISDRVSVEDRTNIAIINARKTFSANLDQQISTSINIKDGKYLTELSLTTAMTIKEDILDVSHKETNELDTTSVKVRFKYNPTDVVERAQEINQNKTLQEKLKNAQSANQNLMKELANTLSSESSMTVSKALELASNKVTITKGGSQHIEVTTLNEQIKGLVGNKIAREQKNKNAFVDAYLPALRDSMKMTYYDVIPFVSGDKTYGIIDWVIDLPLMKNNQLSPVAQTLKLLPEYYKQESRIELNGRKLTNFELINPGFLGIVGGAGGRRILSPAVDRFSHCRGASGFNTAYDSVERDFGIKKYRGVGGRAECGQADYVNMPNPILAATLKGRLMASIRWPELDLYDEIILSDIGSIWIASRSGKTIIPMPLRDIPSLGKVEVSFWIAGIDERPFRQSNVLKWVSQAVSIEASEELILRVEERRKAKYPFSTFPFLANIDRKKARLKGLGADLIKKNSKNKAYLGLEKSNYKAEALDFDTGKFTHDRDYIKVAYKNKNAPKRLNLPYNDEISLVELRFWEYEYANDMTSEAILPAQTYKGIPFIELMYGVAPTLKEFVQAQRNKKYADILMTQ